MKASSNASASLRSRSVLKDSADTSIFVDTFRTVSTQRFSPAVEALSDAGGVVKTTLLVATETLLDVMNAELVSWTMDDTEAVLDIWVVGDSETLLVSMDTRDSETVLVS